MAHTKFYPLEIRVDASRQKLRLIFSHNKLVEFTAEFLRVHSPSAEVKGHSTDQKKIISGKKDVKINKVEPVGNYAIRIHFDDLHNTGIFMWDYFQDLENSREKLWSTYLQTLKARGLSRFVSE